MKMNYEERKNYLGYLDFKIEDAEFHIDYMKYYYDMSDKDVREDIEYLKGQKECFEDVHRYVSQNEDADYRKFISDYVSEMERVQKTFLCDFPGDIVNFYIKGRLNCFRYLLKHIA